MELKRCSMHPVPNTYQERYRLPNKKPSTIDNSEALIFLNLGEEGSGGKGRPAEGEAQGVRGGQAGGQGAPNGGKRLQGADIFSLSTQIYL